jgi:hypothetical protein
MVAEEPANRSAQDPPHQATVWGKVGKASFRVLQVLALLATIVAASKGCGLV